MPVFRNKPRRDFTIIRNAALRDRLLSLKAKGMLALMLSFPDDWVYLPSHLESLSTDGRDGTRAAIRELVEHGYIRRVQTRTDDGKLAHAQYAVSDAVDTVDGKTVDGKTVAGKPATTKTEDLTKTEGTKTTDLQPLSAAPTRAGQTLVDIWNEERGQLPAVRTLTGSRDRACRKLMQELGPDAVEMFRAAVRQVARNEYWLEKGYGFDNLLRGGKVVTYAEQHVHGGGMSRGDKRITNTAMEIADAIGGLQ